jgi:hypothetical protein
MTTVYRITESPQVGDVVDSTEALEAFARAHGPGRYHVDEHSLEPFEGTKVVASLDCHAEKKRPNISPDFMRYLGYNQPSFAVF